jgi:A/G-specific adenine glycosylase
LSAASNRRDIATTLLRWFERHGRSTLPWRTIVDPYRTVVSEFMLQQTQVDRVVPLFDAFVAMWPSFATLAAASQADVVRAWKGLGYNSRAVRLRDLARTVCERYGGKLPSDERSLLDLPGVGPYTARAIAAFAFGADVPALDTNVRRIVHRTQLGLEWPPRANEARLDAIAAELVPKGAGHAFNSAMMDLGATICTARAPKCLICPLRATCAAAPVCGPELARLAASHAPPRGAQSRMRFEETDRFVRGRVVDRLRDLPPDQRISLLALHAELSPALVRHDAAAFEAVVVALAHERIVDDSEGGLRLVQ